MKICKHFLSIYTVMNFLTHGVADQRNCSSSDGSQCCESGWRHLCWVGRGHWGSRRARIVWCFFPNHIFHWKVRYTSDFYDPPESEDFMDFQQKWMWDIRITNPYKRPQFCCREIPRDFCKKDRNTGVQAAFHCIICNCDLRCWSFYFSFYHKIWVGSLKYLLWLVRDVDGLRNHVMGEKHVRKAIDYKCQVMGIDKQVTNRESFSLSS